MLFYVNNGVLDSTSILQSLLNCICSRIKSIFRRPILVYEKCDNDKGCQHFSYIRGPRLKSDLIRLCSCETPLCFSSRERDQAFLQVISWLLPIVPKFSVECSTSGKYSYYRSRDIVLRSGKHVKYTLFFNLLCKG